MKTKSYIVLATIFMTLILSFAIIEYRDVQNLGDVFAEDTVNDDTHHGGMESQPTEDQVLSTEEIFQEILAEQRRLKGVPRSLDIPNDSYPVGDYYDRSQHNAVYRDIIDASK